MKKLIRFSTIPQILFNHLNQNSLFAYSKYIETTTIPDLQVFKRHIKLYYPHFIKL